MGRFLAAAIVVTAWFVGSTVSAQEKPLVTLQPPDAARWDAAGHIGWLGINHGEIGAGWGNWHDAASFGVSGGYYLRPHLKLEVDAAATTETQFFSYVPVFELGAYGHSRYYQSKVTTIGATAVYQLFENAWFHPFGGVGLDVARESDRYSSPAQLVPGPDGRLTQLLPAEERGWESVTTLRPAATAGFKWYVGERVFIRSDVRAAFSSKRMESTVWRSGIGFDF